MIDELPSSPQPTRRGTPTTVIAGSLLLGLIAGGLAGGLVGGRVAQGGWQALWKSVSTASQTNTNTSTTAQTLSVQEDSATTDVVKKVSPAVVSIIATKDYSKVFQNPRSSPLDDFFGLPFGDSGTDSQAQGKQQVGGGTGFIVEADGTIVTNKHVVTVPGADEYTVVLNNSKSYPAKILALDPGRDVAVIKIEEQNLPTVSLGASDNLEVGQTVVAIGNALGEFRNTATKGIISGLSRTITAGDSSGFGAREVIEGAIQTDAAINPGNSGGPLLNLAGQVIGVNTAVSGQGQNIGFAIPIAVVTDDLASVKQSGKIVRPFLGVCYQPIDKAIAQQNNLPVESGALVVRGQGCAAAIVPSGPADKAGIVENDIILEIGGDKITADTSLAALISQHKVGEQVDVKILRKGEEKTLQVTLQERQET